MRRRLVISYLLLMVLVLIALETPLAVTLASRETDRVRADRLADATRFASLAGPALRGGSPARSAGAGRLRRPLPHRRGRGRPGPPHRRSPRPGSRPRAPAARSTSRCPGSSSAAGVDLALVDGPLVMAVPINDGGEVLGAVVIVTPADPVRRTVTPWWLMLAGIGLLAVLACVSTAFGLAGWVLRPVTELDAVDPRDRRGRRTARVRHRLGPPELRRLATSFNDMVDAVSDVMDRQRAFVAHASHQLRNPLTALRLRVEELGPSLTDPDGRAEHRLALEETDRLAHGARRAAHPGPGRTGGEPAGHRGRRRGGRVPGRGLAAAGPAPGGHAPARRGRRAGVRADRADRHRPGARRPDRQRGEVQRRRAER